MIVIHMLLLIHAFAACSDVLFSTPQFILEDFYKPYDDQNLFLLCNAINESKQQYKITYNENYIAMLQQSITSKTCKNVFTLIKYCRLVWLLENGLLNETLWNEYFVMNSLISIITITDPFVLESYHFPFYVFSRLLENSTMRKFSHTFIAKIIYSETVTQTLNYAISLFNPTKALSLSQSLHNSTHLNSTESDAISNTQELSIGDYRFIKNVFGCIKTISSFTPLIPYIENHDIPLKINKYIFSVMEKNSSLKAPSKHRSDHFYNFLKNVTEPTKEIYSIYYSYCNVLVTGNSSITEECAQLFVDFFVEQCMNYDFMKHFKHTDKLSSLFKRFMSSTFAPKLFEKTLNKIENVITDLNTMIQSDNITIVGTYQQSDKRKILSTMISIYLLFVKQLRVADALSSDEKLNRLFVDLIALSIRCGGTFEWTKRVGGVVKNVDLIQLPLFQRLIEKSCEALDAVATECGMNDYIPSFFYNIESIDDDYRFDYQTSLIFADSVPSSHKGKTTSLVSMSQLQTEIYHKYGIRLLGNEIGINGPILFIRALCMFHDILSTFGGMFSKEQVITLLKKKSHFNVPYEYFRIFDVECPTSTSIKGALIDLSKECLKNIIDRITAGETPNPIDIIKPLGYVKYLYKEDSNFLSEHFTKDQLMTLINYISKNLLFHLSKHPDFNPELLHFTSTNSIDSRYRDIALYDYLGYMLSFKQSITIDILKNALLPYLSTHPFEFNNMVFLIFYCNFSELKDFKETKETRCIVQHFTQYYKYVMTFLSQQSDVNNFIPLKLFYKFICQRVVTREKQIPDSYAPFVSSVIAPLTFDLPEAVFPYYLCCSIEFLTIFNFSGKTNLQQLESPFQQIKEKIALTYVTTLEEYCLKTVQLDKIFSDIQCSIAFAKLLLYTQNAEEVMRINKYLLEHITEGGLYFLKTLLGSQEFVRNDTIDLEPFFELLTIADDYQKVSSDILNILIKESNKKFSLIEKHVPTLLPRIETVITNLHYKSYDSIVLLNALLRLLNLIQPLKEQKVCFIQFLIDMESQIAQYSELLLNTLQPHHISEHLSIKKQDVTTFPCVCYPMILQMSNRINDITTILKEQQFTNHSFLDFLNIRRSYFNIVYASVYNIMSDLDKKQFLKILKQTLQQRISIYTAVDKCCEILDNLYCTCSTVMEVTDKDIQNLLHKIIINSPSVDDFSHSIPPEEITEDYLRSFVCHPVVMHHPQPIPKTLESFLQNRLETIVSKKTISIIHTQRTKKTETPTEQTSIFDSSNDGVFGSLFSSKDLDNFAKENNAPPPPPLPNATRTRENNLRTLIEQGDIDGDTITQIIEEIDNNAGSNDGDNVEEENQETGDRNEFVNLLRNALRTAVRRTEEQGNVERETSSDLSTEESGDENIPSFGLFDSPRENQQETNATTLPPPPPPTQDLPPNNPPQAQRRNSIEGNNNGNLLNDIRRGVQLRRTRITDEQQTIAEIDITQRPRQRSVGLTPPPAPPIPPTLVTNQQTEDNEPNMTGIEDLFNFNYLEPNATTQNQQNDQQTTPQTEQAEITTQQDEIAAATATASVQQDEIAAATAAAQRAAEEEERTALEITQQIRRQQQEQQPVEQNPPQQEPQQLPPDIDEETFNQLPPEIQQEILAEYRQQQQRPPRQQPTQQPREESTVDFIYDLDPLLREDILRNADEAMMQLLPADLREEARGLQRDGRQYGPMNNGIFSDDSSEPSSSTHADHFNALTFPNQSSTIPKLSTDLTDTDATISKVITLASAFLNNNHIAGLVALKHLHALLTRFNETNSDLYFKSISAIFQRLLLKQFMTKNIVRTEKALKLLLAVMFQRAPKVTKGASVIVAEIQPIIAYFLKDVEAPDFIRHLTAAAFARVLMDVTKATGAAPYILFEPGSLVDFAVALQNDYGVIGEKSISDALHLLFTNPGTSQTIAAVLDDYWTLVTTAEPTANTLIKVESFCACISRALEVDSKTVKTIISRFGDRCKQQDIQAFEAILKKRKDLRVHLLPIVYSFVYFSAIANPELLGAMVYIDQFLDKWKETVEKILQVHPDMVQTTFSLLRKYPKYLTFESKAAVFRKEIRKVQKRHQRRGYQIAVHRDNIFQESYGQLQYATSDDLKGKLRVKFVGEQGIDMGGLRKEWLRVIAVSMFNPDYLLFLPTDDGHFQPNPMSALFGDVDLYRFIGRVVAKTVYDGEFLDVNFTKSVYKMLLQQEVTLTDMESIDQLYYKNLKWLLDNSVEGLDMKFCFEKEEFGRTIVDDLIPNGRNIDVTDDNKTEYVKLLVQYKLYTSVKRQVELFKEGFYSIIPFNQISYFYDTELELLISGLPDIDPDDLKANTEYRGYNADSQLVQWFWEIFYEFEHRQKVLLLQFVTGSSKVPLGGFKNLTGNSGIMLFTIQKIPRCDSLPVAHTCFNTIDIPDYKSIDTLREKLLFAISECNQGFGMA
ncbi:HECT-type E3 ubiquitin transferase [Entamoeba marina]